MKTSTLRSATINAQQGFTLVELLSVLAIGGLLIAGALSLNTGASALQTSNQTLTELTTIGVAVKSVFYGSGDYGTVNINQVLVSGSKVPNTIVVTAGTPPVLTNSFGGTVNVTGATATYNIDLTSVPTDVCLALLTGSRGWSNIKTAAVSHTTFPVSPITAATDCAATNPIAMTFTGS